MKPVERREKTAQPNSSHKPSRSLTAPMESEIHKKPDPEEAGTRDSVSSNRARLSQAGSHSMSEIPRESIKDEAAVGLQESSCRSPSEEKSLSEKDQNVDRKCEATRAHSHTHQLRLSQHAGAWDSIARVNEEILLTMLDIYEKYKSKTKR